jgi:hypothetical protein
MAKTGRVFECLSLKGLESMLMADWFTIGKKYYEADIDALGNEDMSDDTSVLLFSDYVTTDGYGVAMYVDLMDFEHVAQTQNICLN